MPQQLDWGQTKSRSVEFNLHLSGPKYLSPHLLPLRMHNTRKLNHKWNGRSGTQVRHLGFTGGQCPKQQLNYRTQGLPSLLLDYSRFSCGMKGGSQSMDDCFEDEFESVFSIVFLKLVVQIWQ